MFHKTVSTIALAFLFGSVSVSPAVADQHPANDIVDTAVAAGSFKTLVAAAQAAGLVETLKGDGPFTVFAPSDDAFARLPEGTVESLLKEENREQLRAVLLYHVVPGRMPASEVVKARELKTAQGSSLAVKVDQGTVHIDGAKVVTADIQTRNGIIHVIDAVVLPKAARH
jgi:transforming growth factor-beta-induced protein